MTLSKFIKQLQALEAKGYGSCPINADKPTLWDGNGTFDICEVKSATAMLINIVDGDGGIVSNKDGSERLRYMIVLKGKS